MKKLSAALVGAIGVLGGCSMLEGVNNSLSYVNEATEYANEASSFAQEAPSLAEQAVQDPDAAGELETKLEEMKADIEEFNELDAPSVAEDLHQQVVSQNDKALEGIQVYLDNVENGTLDPSVIENTELFQTMSELSQIVDQIEEIQQLGE
ncbi:DUF6376 family protein [Halobacillus sp. ACCC02827]|uniref:DUF6376 family protein n=1 Tax=Bacillaceae TaxID=186817 RepID=UPI0002A5029E|nr:MULTISPECIES: DUF6376 family protein [Bacillaceae]ELK46608.1 hypothetical protein D479_10116 [Halobacillus sp. BAB-2008]QHT45517.1 hypothetical protein M662_02970 [Bacillus sp. SB49]WJE16319.1 DUF6376 family protein [Halobacillus sp. ACCC02827]